MEKWQQQFFAFLSFVFVFVAGSQYFVLKSEGYWVRLLQIL
jgi:hypothetical protein